MAYYMDLASISIEAYKRKLEIQYLPPGRMVLKEKIDERMGYFEHIGIRNLKELMVLLKKKDKLEELSKTECFSGNYLVVLLRELKSILPKPNKIKDFKGISEETVLKLEHIGIKDTAKLYEKVKDSKSRLFLSETTGIEVGEILKLTKLTDISRIKWVGVSFASLLYELGVDTVGLACQADPVELHKKINQFNKQKKIFKGQIGLNDIRIFVEAAKDVPQDICFD